MPGSSELSTTAVIPTCNRPRFLAEAIESVLAQTRPAFEVLVVDDGSTENYAETICARFGGRVRCLRKANGGLSSARNHGIRHATGALVAILDDDDRWYPNKLERQVPLFADPEVGIAYANSRIFDHETGKTLEVEELPGEIGVHEILSHKIPRTNAAVFRRELAIEIGGFDESLLAIEDLDFFARMAAVSRMVGVPDVLGEYRQHTGARIMGGGYRLYKWQRKAILKNSHHHGPCETCRAIVRSSLNEIWKWPYRELCARSNELLRAGRYAEAISVRATAVSLSPARAARAMVAGTLAQVRARDEAHPGR